MTIEEYLKFEREALEKHEFVEGQLLQLTPSTVRHALISANACGSISRQTEATCFANCLRVLVVPGSFIAYPDMSALVGKIATNAANDVLLNPTFLLEVVSPKTVEHDRGFKAFLYRDMPSVQEFLLVDELSVFVDRYTRQTDRSWIITNFQSLDDVIRLQSLGCSVAVSEFYHKIEML